MLSMSRFVHTYYFMSSSQESEGYISPSLSSSIMTVISSKKRLKKKIKKRKQLLGNSKYVRNINN
jgi:hypothetical protein